MSNATDANNPVTIDKHIPLPKERAWPLSDMDIGDSFAVESHRVAALRSSIAYEQARSEKKFTVRKAPQEIRCWRIA